MTAIAGLILEDGTVYMGSDALAVNPHTLEAIVMRADKIFSMTTRREDDHEAEVVLVGGAGSPRVAQLLQYSVQLPPLAKDRDEYDYVVNEFVGAIHEIREKAHAEATDEGQASMRGSLLVAVRGRLFAIYDDFVVSESSDAFDAIGCGAPFVLASLRTTARHGGLAPEARLREALESAAHLSAGVRGPFTIIKLDPPSHA